MGRQVLTFPPQKMKSVGSSKIPVNFYRITHCHIPEQPAFFKFLLVLYTTPDIISTYCEADHATDTTLSDIIFHCILCIVSKYNFQLLMKCQIVSVCCIMSQVHTQDGVCVCVCVCWVAASQMEIKEMQIL